MCARKICHSLRVFTCELEQTDVSRSGVLPSVVGFSSLHRIPQELLSCVLLFTYFDNTLGARPNLA